MPKNYRDSPLPRRPFGPVPYHPILERRSFFFSIRSRFEVWIKKAKRQYSAIKADPTKARTKASSSTERSQSF